jgi:hypothetical protein
VSNALEQARKLRDDTTITTAVRIPLDVLEGLIAEIETLNAKLAKAENMLDNYKAAHPDTSFMKAVK